MKKNNSLIKIAETLKSHPFTPSPFLRNPYMQIAAFLLTPYAKFPIPKMEYRLIELADGSKTSAQCWFQKEKSKCATVVILNGFEGDEDAIPRFSKAVIGKAFHAGYNVIMLRQRGEGETIHLTKSIGDFHADDIPLIFQTLHQWGVTKMYIVALSLGAWSTLLATGKMSASPSKNLAGVVALSTPINTPETWKHIEKNSRFDKMLLQAYKRLIKRRMAVDPPDTWDKKQLESIRSKREFFETYMHLFGYPKRFSSVDEFFEQTDITPYLPHLTVPTLIIHAQDDPVTPAHHFGKPEVQNNPNLITLLPPHGGHCCFITNKKQWEDPDRYWAQNRAIEFINLLEKQSN